MPDSLIADLADTFPLQSQFLTDLSHGQTGHTQTIETLHDLTLAAVKLVKKFDELILQQTVVEVLIGVRGILIGNDTAKTQLCRAPTGASIDNGRPI